MSKSKPSLLPRRGDGRNWLYALGLGDGRIKIGRTGKPRDRLAQHRKTFGDVIVWFHLGPRVHRQCYSAHMVERRAIDTLAKLGARIGNTEMFRDIDKATVLRILRESIALAHAADAEWSAQSSISAAKQARLRRAWDAFRAQYRDPLDILQPTDQPATMAGG